MKERVLRVKNAQHGVHADGWILSARALRWAMVAVECSLARSHRQTGFIMTLGYLRFVGESRPSSRWPVPRRGISSQEDDVAGRWAGNGLDTHMEG